MGIKINTKKLSPDNTKLYDKENHLIGEVRSAAFSPKFEKIVGIAMIKKEFYKDNKSFIISENRKLIDGEVCNLPIT